jgi:two-component system CheB/CheR fusion protein
LLKAARARRPSPTSPKDADRVPVKVVGIGASAGGLNALKDLIADLPAESGIAFVILQHRAMSQPSLLSAVLAAATKLPVVDIHSGQRIEANQIYVVPPGVEATLRQGALMLRLQKDAARRRLPIDGLFASLAKALGTEAVGVVLSGTASDGTEGLRAIQTAGGTTFAQEPDSAEYDGMPRSAIAAGVADFVLTPKEIGRDLAQLPHRPAHARSRLAAPARPEKGIEKILALLRDTAGVDFTFYKRATIERRLSRRMAERKIKSLDQYADYIGAHQTEATALYEDLLIHVTEFFRNADALDVLPARVFPELITDRPAGQAIRVWVPGCSTGQEVYSLAILLLEFLGDRAAARSIQIFGTDLSERAIETARSGRYSGRIVDEVSPERLNRFFTRSEGGWRINKEVRDRCVFVRHDLLSDPPFSRIDLLSCRNVLIYFGASLQKQVIPLFHYALNQPGFLLLGRSESVTGFGNFFSPLDAHHQVYARRPNGGRSGLTFAAGASAGRVPHQKINEPARSNVGVQRKVDHILLARYAPACVLVDADLDIQQFRGRTGPYLEPAPGRAHLNLLKMARDGLMPELRLAIHRAAQEDAPVRSENVRLRDGGSERRIAIEVVPLRGAEPKEHYFLILFIEGTGAADGGTATTRKRGDAKVRRSSPSADSSQISGLRQELAAAKEYLMSLTTQHAAANEELALTNEELLSGNEELQSTNEELATAKEEMESTNEELATVNDELRRRNQDLILLNDDLVNLLAAVDIAIVIVDSQRRVRRFTPKARAVMNLIPADVGRAIGDLKLNVDVADLEGAIADVISSLIMSEVEVNAPNGSVYRMQIRPYRTNDDKISGAVVSFVDITILRQHLEEARLARDYADAIVEAVPEPLVIVDGALRVRSGNRAFYAMVGLPAPQAEGRALLDLGTERWRGLADGLERALRKGSAFDDMEIDNGATGDARQVLLVSARPLPGDSPLPRPARAAAKAGHGLMLVALLDITDRKQAEVERARLDEIAREARANQAVSLEREALLDAVSHELRTPLNAILLWTRLLRQNVARDAQLLRGIDTIERSARTEAQLVDDLVDLSLSRLSARQLKVSVEAVDPAPIVEAALDAVRREAGTKDIVFDVDIETGTELVLADPNRLQQIAWNLLANGIKFSLPGGRVRVSLRPREAQIELQVQDHGRGIRSDFVAHLFEPFSREDRSTTQRAGGLGIGLALVRHLVERQEGTISVESAGEGHGATFTVRLPRVGHLGHNGHGRGDDA